MSAIPVGGQPRTGVARSVATGARVYLHSPARRAYVASVIAPITQNLNTEFGARRIHLSTGWRFGPHFDVRAEALPAQPIDWDGIADTLAEGARHFPAPDIENEASQTEYLRTATMLGRLEAVPPPYLPRHPHGHTELLSPESGPLGDLPPTGLAHLLTPLSQVAAARSSGALLAQVAEAFLALADTHPYGVRFGSFSFRSHAEAFFHWAGPAADYRRSFEKRLGKDRAVLEELVRRVRDGAQSPSALAWSKAFIDCQADFAGKVTDEDLAHAAPVATDRNGRPEGRSDFHVAITSSGVIDEPPSWFAGYRLTINLFYQLLPALDISPIQRFYLCHAIGESVDAVYDESWQSRLAAIASLTGAAAR